MHPLAFPILVTMIVLAVIGTIPWWVPLLTWMTHWKLTVRG